VSKAKLFITIAIVFIAGFLLASALQTNLELPLSMASGATGKAIEKISPAEHIEMDQIHVNKDSVVIDINDANWATFADTNSMDPVIDKGSYGIEITPKSISDINIGDIISYKSEQGIIIHRVISTGIDQNGWYAITKGDNVPVQDPDKVRFSQVKGILVAIVY
jgi:hypothetical protein